MNFNIVFDIFLKPSKSFSDISKMKINMIIPFLLVIFSAIIGGIWNFIQKEQSYNKLYALSQSKYISPLFRDLLIKKVDLHDEILRALVLTIILWIILGFLVFIISKSIGGKGTLVDTLKMIGLSYFSLGIGSSIGLIFLIFSNFIGSIIQVISGFWFFVLKIIAIREINDFATGKAVASVFISQSILTILVFLIVLKLSFQTY